MDWFINKVFSCRYRPQCNLMSIQGKIVEEEKPLRLEYSEMFRVSFGPPDIVNVDIEVCSDPENRGAPMYYNISEGLSTSSGIRSLTLRLTL